MDLSERVSRCEDGKYRWLYELDMYKNPSIFYTVAKVVGICLLLPIGMIVFLGIRERQSLTDILMELAPVYVVIGILVLITGFSYWYVAHMYGGRYCAVYEMDEYGVEAKQIKKQFEKQKVIAEFAAWTAALTGNPGLMGSALYNMTNDSSYSEFRKVYSVRSFKGRDLIKVNSPFLFNQIYVGKEDFDFVENYIREHCAKVKG